MFLEYGVDDHGELIYIGQVGRGLTTLKCPYCGGRLVAKKGEIVTAHFAHAGETCAQVGRDIESISLPCYDNFNLHVPGAVVEELKKFVEHPSSRYYVSQVLEEYELIAFNEWAGRGGSHELTKKGKLILGQLSLMLFNHFQEPLIAARHADLEGVATRLHDARDGIARLIAIHARQRELEEMTPWTREIRNEMNKLSAETLQLRNQSPPGRELRLGFDTALADLRLYRAQMRRILSCTLYFLSINGGALHKVGVTTRVIDERLEEIVADLRPHFGAVKIDVIDTWPHRGNVELYFKHRYRESQQQIGVLTEYYKFEDPKAVIRDLRRMKVKELSDLERGILAGDVSDLEHTIAAEAIEQKRRAAIRAAMKRAAARGKHIGRPAGVESDESFLAKPSSVAAREALGRGLSLREAARAAGVSINTVRKVKEALQSNE